MKVKLPKELSLFSTKRIIVPIIIGLIVVGWFLYDRFDLNAIQKIEWNSTSWLWLGVALLMMVIRQVAYMYRIQVLSNHQLKTKASFQIIGIWEFASAVTPSIIGGTAIALFLFAREKISLGRSTAITLLTALFDTLFFILFAPIFFLLAGRTVMFPTVEDCILKLDIPFIKSLDSLLYTFFVGYGFLIVYACLIGYGVLVNPKALQNLIKNVFKLRILKKWKEGALQTGEDIIIASAELKKEKLGFWLKSFLATCASWLARYFIVNCILMIVFGSTEHLAIFARQFVLWIILMIPTTPGSSGIAEIGFLAVFCEFMDSSLNAAVVLIWRILTYYPYLFLGLLVLPRWIKRVYSSSGANS